MQQVYVAAALSALALFVRAELPARVASTAALPRSTPNATASSTASPMAGEAVSSTVPVQLQHHRTTAGLIVGAVTAPPHHRRSTTAPPHHRRSTTAAPPHHRQSQLHQLHHLKWQLHQLLLRQSQLHHRRSTTAAPPNLRRRGAGGGAKKHKHRRMIAGRFVVHICGAVVSLVFVTLSGVALYRRRRTKKFCSVQVVRNIDLGHSASEIVRRGGVPDGRRAGQHRGAGAAAAPPPAPPPPVAVAPVAPPPYDRRPDCRLSTVRNAVTLKDKTRRLFFPIVDDRESLITDQREDV